MTPWGRSLKPLGGRPLGSRTGGGVAWIIVVGSITTGVGGPGGVAWIIVAGSMVGPASGGGPTSGGGACGAEGNRA